MKINIIAVGKLNKEFQSMFNNYVKKINFYSTVNVIEIKELNESNIEVKKQKETDLILNSVPKNSKVFLCSLQGKDMTSEEFSTTLEEDNVTFVIGGSNGVIEDKFQNKIRFSKMTFPHQLFRVFLIEQIYRGFSILKNLKYHK